MRSKVSLSEEIHLNVKEKTSPGQHPLNLSVLGLRICNLIFKKRSFVSFYVIEHTGSIHLDCSFTYDFSLHESLETWWNINDGTSNRQIKTVGDRIVEQSADQPVLTDKNQRVIATGVRSRAIFLNYPYSKVSTIYMRLSISDAIVEDSGNYSCHAKTRLDSTQSNLAQINVYYRTKLLRPPEDVSAVLSGQSSLTCNFLIDSRLISEAEIYWTANNQPTASKRTKIAASNNNKNTWMITHKIENVTKNDVGRYKCHVITSFDSAYSGASILRLMTGSIITLHPSNVVTVLGGVAQFR